MASAVSVHPIDLITDESHNINGTFHVGEPRHCPQHALILLHNSDFMLCMQLWLQSHRRPYCEFVQ